jgi:hypothetical protein
VACAFCGSPANIPGLGPPLAWENLIAFVNQHASVLLAVPAEIELHRGCAAHLCALLVAAGYDRYGGIPGGWDVGPGPAHH